MMLHSARCELLVAGDKISLFGYIVSPVPTKTDITTGIGLNRCLKPTYAELQSKTAGINWG